jgi:hypothetical protein
VVIREKSGISSLLDCFWQARAVTLDGADCKQSKVECSSLSGKVKARWRLIGCSIVEVHSSAKFVCQYVHKWQQKGLVAFQSLNINMTFFQRSYGQAECFDCKVRKSGNVVLFVFLLDWSFRICLSYGGLMNRRALSEWPVEWPAGEDTPEVERARSRYRTARNSVYEAEARQRLLQRKLKSLEVPVLSTAFFPPFPLFFPFFVKKENPEYRKPGGEI